MEYSEEMKMILEFEQRRMFTVKEDKKTLCGWKTAWRHRSHTEGLLFTSDSSAAFLSFFSLKLGLLVKLKHSDLILNQREILQMQFSSSLSMEVDIWQSERLIPNI